MNRIAQLRRSIESADTLYEIISDHIYRRESLSFVRCGDGDGHILDFLYDPDVEMMHWRLKYLFGNASLRLSTLRRLAMDLGGAIENADCLGINLDYPAEELTTIEKTQENTANPFSGLASLYRNLDHLKLAPGTRFFSGHVNEDLVRRGLIYRIISQVDSVTVITSREVVAGRLAAIFDVDVTAHLVPEEQNFAVLAEKPDQASVHFPTRYNELLDQIRPKNRGDLYLVGAGPCGRIYCDLVKRRGGIALDLGAVFDGWAGLITRASFDKTGDIFAKHIEDDLLLTPAAVHKATNGEIDRRDRPIAALPIQNRFLLVAERSIRERMDAKDYERVKAENQQLWARCHNAEAQLERASADNRELLNRCQTSEEKLDRALKDNQTLLLRLQESEETRDRLSEENQELWKRCHSSEQRGEEIATENQRLLQRNRNIDENLTHLVKENQELWKRCHEAEERLEKITTENQELWKRCLGSEDRLQSAQNENDELKARLARLETKLNNIDRRWWFRAARLLRMAGDSP